MEIQCGGMGVFGELVEKMRVFQYYASHALHMRYGGSWEGGFLGGLQPRGTFSIWCPNLSISGTQMAVAVTVVTTTEDMATVSFTIRVKGLVKPIEFQRDVETTIPWDFASSIFAAIEEHVVALS